MSAPHCAPEEHSTHALLTHIRLPLQFVLERQATQVPAGPQCGVGWEHTASVMHGTAASTPPPASAPLPASAALVLPSTPVVEGEESVASPAPELESADDDPFDEPPDEAPAPLEPPPDEPKLVASPRNRSARGVLTRAGWTR